MCIRDRSTLSPSGESIVTASTTAPAGTARCRSHSSPSTRATTMLRRSAYSSAPVVPSSTVRAAESTVMVIWDTVGFSSSSSRCAKRVSMLSSRATRSVATRTWVCRVDQGPTRHTQVTSRRRSEDFLRLAGDLVDDRVAGVRRLVLDCPGDVVDLGVGELAGLRVLRAHGRVGQPGLRVVGVVSLAAEDPLRLVDDLVDPHGNPSSDHSSGGFGRLSTTLPSRRQRCHVAPSTGLSSCPLLRQYVPVSYTHLRAHETR